MIHSKEQGTGKPEERRQICSKPETQEASASDSPHKLCLTTCDVLGYTGRDQERGTCIQEFV